MNAGNTNASLSRRILTPARKKQLDDIGFPWNYSEEKPKNGLNLPSAPKESAQPPVPLKLEQQIIPQIQTVPKSEVKISSDNSNSSRSDEFSGDEGIHGRTYGNNKNWTQCFGMLEAFKKEHGHTQVPYKRFPHNHRITVLSKYVTDMRSQKKSKSKGLPNDLSDEREALLDSIGFEWVTSSAAMNGELPVTTKSLVSTVTVTKEKKFKVEKKDLKILREPAEEPAIIDANGNAWRVYRPISLDKLLRLPENDPPSPKQVAQDPDGYQSDDSGESLVF
jgi:hypothetical protein